MYLRCTQRLYLIQFNEEIECEPTKIEFFFVIKLLQTNLPEWYTIVLFHS